MKCFAAMWNLRVELYSKMGGLRKEFVDEEVQELDKKGLYRAFPIVNHVSRFAEYAKRQLNVKITEKNILFEELPIRYLNLLCRFSDKTTFIGSPSIPRSRRFSRLMRGEALVFLYEIIMNHDYYVLHLDSIRSPTGEIGQAATISLYRLCEMEGCRNLAAPCSKNYALCPFHCKSCEQCQVKREILQMDSAYMVFQDKEFLLNRIRDEVDGDWEAHLKNYIITYPFLNSFFKYSRDEVSAVSRIVRFKSAVNATYCIAILDDMLPEYIKKTLLELTEIGITRIKGPRDHLFGYGQYGVNENFAIGFFSKFPYRRNPVAISVEEEPRRVLREYYPRLFIPLKCSTDFFQWFQRIESRLKTASGAERSEFIGKQIFDMFGEEICNAIGKQSVITDYGGGQGLVLFKFTDNLLSRRKDILLTLKLKDFSVSALNQSEENKEELMEKHKGCFEFETERCDIFDVSSIERGDLALISQVLDLYTDLDAQLQSCPFPVGDIYLELLQGVWADHEAEERWPKTYNVALRLMSPYNYIIAKQVSATKGRFHPDKLYELRLLPDPKVHKWLKKVCENSRYTIIVDRVVNKDLVREVVGDTYDVKGKFSGKLHYTLVKRK